MASVNLHKNEIEISDLWDQKDIQAKISKKNGKTKSKLPFNVFVLIFEGFPLQAKDI